MPGSLKCGPALVLSARSEGKVVKNRLHVDVRVGTGLVGDERGLHLRPNPHNWWSGRIGSYLAQPKHCGALVLSDAERYLISQSKDTDGEGWR